VHFTKTLGFCKDLETKYKEKLYRMNNKVILNLLFKTHVKQTSINPPPFLYKVPFDYETINADILNKVLTNNNIFNIFCKKCYEEFLKIPNITEGSVHINPYVWTNFAVQTIKSFCEKQEKNEIAFPNGCCNMSSTCSINLYYNVVLNALKKL
jgi:hypothetical protein